MKQRPVTWSIPPLSIALAFSLPQRHVDSFLHANTRSKQSERKPTEIKKRLPLIGSRDMLFFPLDFRQRMIFNDRSRRFRVGSDAIWSFSLQAMNKFPCQFRCLLPSLRGASRHAKHSASLIGQRCCGQGLGLITKEPGRQIGRAHV